MKLLFDFFPIIVFFICYKIFDIYVATGVAMAASLLQVVIYRLKTQRFEKMHLLSLAMIFILGGATLFFRNPTFIMWKPTGLYWLAAILFLASSFVGEKPIIKRMMDSNISLPENIWKRLNIAWSIFFLFMGSLNLYIAYNFSINFWVNFKLFGGAGLTLVFILLQAVYLAHHLTDEHAIKRQPSEDT